MTARDTEPEPATVFEQTLEIETPERVRIRYELAGIGSRFAAGTIDIALLAFVTACVLLALLATIGLSFPEIQEEWRAISMGVYGVILVLVWFFYIGFELLWHGQTPGKRVLRLRVVSDDGGPAPASAIIVRNVLRVADMLPLVFVHVLGGVVMFLGSRSKRLGDLAAGTVVVQEREVHLSMDRLSRGVIDQLRDDELSGDEMARIRSFVARRRELRGDARARVAEALAGELRARHDLPEADAESLVVLLASGKRPSELRDLGGPRMRPLEEARPAEPEPFGGVRAEEPRDDGDVGGDGGGA